MAWRSRKRRGFAARRSGLRSPPPTSPPAEADRWTALTAKAGDFETIRHAVDDAGGFVRGLWVTFVSLQAYLAVATGSITHRQLFLEAPIKLPLIDVELPLVAFFTLAPALFLVFHFYLLIQLRLLADKVARLNAVLAAARAATQGPQSASTEEVERALRLQLPNDIIVQYLAGPRDSRERGLRRALGLVAWATLVAAPLLVLTTMQYKFLPYQDVVVTWVHRAAVLFDVAMLWSLWPGVLKRRTRSKARYPGLRRAASFARNALASVAVIWASTQALTFPQEFMDDLPPAQGFHGVMVWWLPAAKSDEKKGEAPSPNEVWPRLRESLLARFTWPERSDNLQFLEATPQANRVIAGTLRLANETLIDEEKAKRGEERGNSRGLKPWEGERTLRFNHPRQFFAADLSNADLTRADLRGSLLDHAFANDVILTGARLDNAHFNFAALDGARLDSVSLYSAQLRGASIVQAQLQGALLDRALLQGASLFAAQLQGASLDGAQLQGASLDLAQLQGASIKSAFVARSYGQPALSPTHGSVITGLVYKNFSGQIFPITDKIVQAWIEEIPRYVKDESNMKRIRDRLMRLTKDGVIIKEDDDIRGIWLEFNNRQFDRDKFARYVADLVCQRNDYHIVLAPYVARALIRNANNGTGVLLINNDALPSILAKMRAGHDNLAACPGVDGFTKDDWAALDKLSQSHKPSSPTPPKTSNAPAPNLP